MAINISASLVKDYLRCSNQARYRLEEPDKATPTVYMTIGNIVHSAIEKHWDNKEKALKYPYNHSFNSAMIQRDLNSIEHYINTFFDHFVQHLSKDDVIEKFFKLKLENGVYLVGKFDRISDGILYDWKTSSTVPSNINDDPQFIIYDYAFNRIYGTHPASNFFASLSTGKLVPYSFDKLYFNELFNKVFPNLINDIRNGNYKRDGIFRKGTCFKCIYKNDCLKRESNVMDDRNFAQK